MQRIFCTCLAHVQRIFCHIFTIVFLYYVAAFQRVIGVLMTYFCNIFRSKLHSILQNIRHAERIYYALLHDKLSATQQHIAYILLLRTQQTPSVILSCSIFRLCIYVAYHEPQYSICLYASTNTNLYPR